MSEENQEMKEYIIFTVQDKEGNDVEMAVVDEFEFEKKSYIAAAVVDGDYIIDDEIYIYKAKANADGDDFTVEKITNQIDLDRVAEAYMAMDHEEE